MFVIRLFLLVPAVMAATLAGGAAQAAAARVTPAIEQLNKLGAHTKEAHATKTPSSSPDAPRMGPGGLMINGIVPNVGSYG